VVADVGAWLGRCACRSEVLDVVLVDEVHLGVAPHRRRIQHREPEIAGNRRH
jgi:hypothetical protein